MTLQQTIRGFVVENFLFGEEIGLHGHTSFLDEGIVDSTGILELVAFIEREYGIRIADDELVPANLDSIDRVAAFVGKKMGNVPPIRMTPSLVNA